jgi:RHH-type transcriptional regulator, proline utilization regulon repressor / proline dehydrogenase / delta 1-pyrroline-5-carboxylate dehydrogenase
VCISPWNFPLAIFTGQMSAALAAGNAVIAKPAEQTPLVAFEAVKLLHQAGVPGEVLSLLPGDGARLGKRLLPDPRVAGVAFTGSNETASIIHRTLAERKGAIVPFIAETGGINAMIVDSSALPEQAVRDVVLSAFDSAGQRCSAARLLFVQEDIADKLITMLKGAIAELKVGDPADYATDVGPVIDEDARRNLDAHKDRMRREAATIIELELPPDTGAGIFVAPAAYEIGAISVLEREVFGPILHVVRYRADQLHEVCEAINNTGLRAHARAAHPDRAHHGRGPPAGAGRQSLRQPQPDRRGGRRPALRRRGPVRHRPEGRRPALPAPLRDRAGGFGRHHRARRQRRAVVAGRRGAAILRDARVAISLSIEGR